MKSGRNYVPLRQNVPNLNLNALEPHNRDSASTHSTSNARVVRIDENVKAEDTEATKLQLLWKPHNASPRFKIA